MEEDIKNGKYHAGTNHPRVWTDDTLDGQLLVQFLAQSMHESFASMLRTQKESLAIANGDMDHDNRHNMEQEKALKNWLRKTLNSVFLTMYIYGIKALKLRYTFLNSTCNQKHTIILK